MESRNDVEIPPPPPPVTDTHTASPADAPKKPWTRPTIRTVDGEVRTGSDPRIPTLRKTPPTGQRPDSARAARRTWRGRWRRAARPTDPCRRRCAARCLGRVLVARRPGGAHLAGLWEFPAESSCRGSRARPALARACRGARGSRPVGASAHSGRALLPGPRRGARRVEGRVVHRRAARPRRTAGGVAGRPRTRSGGVPARRRAGAHRPATAAALPGHPRAARRLERDSSIGSR